MFQTLNGSIYRNFDLGDSLKLLLYWLPVIQQEQIRESAKLMLNFWINNY